MYSAGTACTALVLPAQRWYCLYSAITTRTASVLPIKCWYNSLGAAGAAGAAGAGVDTSGAAIGAAARAAAFSRLQDITH
jgi:hypothetical protein